MDRDIPNTNEIKWFFHCPLCVAELPADQPPRQWMRLEIGFTLLGLQVWCVRHECNMVHVDFEGIKHPANKTRKPE